MDNKLKQLTEKLYNEGVVKGTEEADKIIADANAKAETILSEAESKANTIIQETNKKAKELENNTMNELQLASRQMLDSLKQQLTDLITGEILEETIQPAMSDPAFVKDVILKISEGWAKGEDVNIAIPEKLEKELANTFSSYAKQKLNSGINISSSEILTSGFEAGPADGSYKLSFTDDDFINYFKTFVRPRIVELLFKEK